MKLSSILMLSAATIGVATASSPAAITLVNPSFYGRTNSTSQTWADFGSVSGPNTPTSSNMPAGTANYFDRTAPGDGAFIIAGSTPRGRIYSFNGTVSPEIDVPAYSLGNSGYATVVLQAQVTGAALEPRSFRISDGTNSIGPTGLSVVTQSAQGSQGPTSEYDYTVTWDLIPSTASYVVTYAATGPSSSQSTTRVDTYAQAPEPAALGALTLGVAAMLRRRRSM